MVPQACPKTDDQNWRYERTIQTLEGYCKNRHHLCAILRHPFLLRLISAAFQCSSEYGLLISTKASTGTKTSSDIREVPG